jgi:membrane protein YdbS with pleckstrin-like domain
LKKWQKDAVVLIFAGPLIAVGLIAIWSITGTWNRTLYPGLLFIALVTVIVLVLFYPDLRKLTSKSQQLS